MNKNPDPLALNPDPWRIGLGQNQVLRHTMRRDRLALSWLLSTGAHVHDARGHESLRELVAERCGMLWVSGRSIQGVLLPSPYRKPVAVLRYLAIRSHSGCDTFFGTVLPHLESRLAEMGFGWLGLHRCPTWLVDEIARRGYAIKDRIVGYRRPHLRGDTPQSGSHSIRGATLGDVLSVLAVDCAAFEPFWRLNRLNIQRAARTCPYFSLTEEDGHVLAYLMAERMGTQGYVSRIGVRPDCQGRGLGTALMSHALSMMARDGLHSVELDTQENNERSQALYERLGFDAVGEVDVYWARSLR